jgi:hypothetical protein
VLEKERLKMSLKEKMMGLNSREGIPFMKDRTKGDIREILNQNVTIKDFDFITGNDGEYVVFIIDEVKDSFFFGGSVLTSNLASLTEEEKKEVKEQGLPVNLYEAKSKNNRKYIGATFYPEETQDDLPF